MTTSPDATPYVDLRVYDRDAQDVFEASIAILATYLPDWIPREGQTEVLLLEALALEVEEDIFTINRMPGALLQVLLRLYGIERSAGTAPSATFTFTMIDNAGYSLPAGVRIALPLSDGETSMIFTTSAAVVAAPGSMTVDAVAVGDTATSLVNGTIPGSPVELLDSLSIVESVALTSYVTGGVDPEDDTAYFTRGVQRFSRLAETLVLPRHFSAAALERVEVSRAQAVDNLDPSSGNPPGGDPGHITLAVYGDGALLDAGQKAAILADVDARAQANLAVHVVDPTITDVNVTATLLALPGYVSADVQTAAIAALTDYLSPEQWPWAATVYRNELISLLDRVEGVDRVVSVTTPDTPLTGVAPLARLGVPSITVTP